MNTQNENIILEIARHRLISKKESGVNEEIEKVADDDVSCK